MNIICFLKKRKRKRAFLRRFGCLLTAAAVLFCLTGCSGGLTHGGRERIRLTIWSPFEDQSEASGQWLQQCCQAFAQLHPEWNITFYYGIVDESISAETIIQDPEAGADIFLTSSDNLGSLADIQAIARFGGKYEAQIREDISENVAESATYRGSLYGIPFTANTWYMYYDRRVFSEEDIKSLDAMLEKGVVSFPLTNAWYLPAFYLGNGCTYFGDGTQAELGADFGGDKAVEVTDYLVDLVGNPNFTVDADGSGIAGMRDGTVNAMFSGSWDYKNLQEILGENLGAASVPCYTLNGENRQMYAFAGTKTICVNSYTAHMVAAVELAIYLGSSQAQKLHYELRSVIPCSLDLIDDPEIAGDPVFFAQNDTVDRTSVWQPSIPEMNSCWDPMASMGKLLRSGAVTHENARQQTESMNAAMNSSGIG